MVALTSWGHQKVVMGRINGVTSLGNILTFCREKKDCATFMDSRDVRAN